MLRSLRALPSRKLCLVDHFISCGVTVPATITPVAGCGAAAAGLQ